MSIFIGMSGDKDLKELKIPHKQTSTIISALQINWINTRNRYNAEEGAYLSRSIVKGGMLLTEQS